MDEIGSDASVAAAADRIFGDAEPRCEGAQTQRVHFTSLLNLFLQPREETFFLKFFEKAHVDEFFGFF